MQSLRFERMLCKHEDDVFTTQPLLRIVRSMLTALQASKDYIQTWNVYNLRR